MLTLLIALVPHVSPSVLVLAHAHALAATGSRTVRRGGGEEGGGALARRDGRQQLHVVRLPRYFVGGASEAFF